MDKEDFAPGIWARAHQVVEDIQKHTGAQARAVIEKLDIDGAQCANIFEEILVEPSDRAVAITVYALFDNVLLEVFTKNLNPDTPGGIDSILNPSGFLGTSHNQP
jgi:hypothetical protein